MTILIAATLVFLTVLYIILQVYSIFLISYSKSSTLKDVEAEYIKNLQQQIYFLELEAEYLRQQTKKATDIHPKMTKEADRMMYKLKVCKNLPTYLHYITFLLLLVLKFMKYRFTVNFYCDSNVLG